MSESICQIHFEQIISKDDNNQNQCKACIEKELTDKIIKIEKAIKVSKAILNQSKNNNEIMKIQKTIDLLKKYKLDLPQSFDEKRNLYKQELQVIENQKYKKFHYKLINEYPNMMNCYSFVFNQDSTRLFIGQGCDIKVYEFKNGEIKKQLQTLKQHTYLFYSLIYMNKSNQLVSGNLDGLVVIWNQDQNGSWKQNYILKGHKDIIRYLINNEGEDLLISSDYYKIKFWKKISLNWSCEQTIQTEFKAYGLSLSKSQKKLISCGSWPMQILVMEQKLDQKFIISQKINTNYHGQHLLFITDNQFVYQCGLNYLQIYLYNQEKKQYTEDKQINFQNIYEGFCFIFPCKYIEQKNIFIIKHDKYLNCFRIDQDENYILQQSIEQYDLFYGNISNNGQYIITQQDNSDKIEIRELQYLE